MQCPDFHGRVQCTLEAEDLKENLIDGKRNFFEKKKRLTYEPFKKF